MKILDFLKQNIVLLDGATGSLLQKRGLPAGVRPETANITDAQLLIQIHKEYYDAGSNIVNTNTFGANTLSFDEEELEKIISAAILNVRTAAELSKSEQEKFVSYDMGPTGKLLKPYGDLDFEEAVRIFGIQARLAEKYGAEVIGVDDLNQTLELVLSGRIDATLNTEVTYYDYMKAHPDSGLKIAAYGSEVTSIGIPVRKGSESESLLTAINEALADMDEAGELSELSMKYFDTDISKK